MASNTPSSSLPAPQPQPDPDAQRTAAADVIRSSINQIYEGDDAPLKQEQNELAAKEQAAQPNPQPTTHHSTQTKTKETIAPKADVPLWQHYHTSWQSYYQQYYERYYLNQIHKLHRQAATPQTSATKTIIGSHPDGETREDSRINELRGQLLGTVKERATKVKKSRHFAPIATAVVFALVFLFLQYNRLLFATVEAYISPGSIDPQNIIVDPNAGIKVGPEPKLVIPKINVDAPMIYGVNAADNNAVEDNLRRGVVHYPIAGASSVPGQNGPTVILGHSSNDVFDNGAYKFVFVQLSKLEIGDTFSINYQGTRYTYSVTKKEIISPNEVNKVASDPSKPSAILITCDPPGTALKRLLVFADQVTPDPSKASTPSSTTEPTSNNIGGNGTTFLERLFGAR